MVHISAQRSRAGGSKSSSPRASGSIHSRADVLTRLRSRGVDIDTRPDESSEAFDQRLATALMALYRDTRSQVVFEALYEIARPSVKAWISSLLRRYRSRLDPAELLQDTFINVYRYPTAFRDERDASFRVWVRTIAGNRLRRALAPQRGLFLQEFPEGAMDLGDLRACPARLAETDEQSALLHSAWRLFLWHYARASEHLSARDRRALELVEVQGMPYKEAGTVLEVGRSNMKMIVFRARKRLARRMREAMSGALAPARRERGLLRGAA